MTRLPIVTLHRYRVVPLSGGRMLVSAPNLPSRVMRADGTPERIQPVGDGEK